MPSSCPARPAFLTTAPRSTSHRRWFAVAFVVVFGATTARAATSTAPDACPEVTGSDTAHEANAWWRGTHITHQSVDADGFTLTVRGQPLAAGGETLLSGIEIDDVERVQNDAGESEWVARVRLAPNLAGVCGTDEIALRIDDAVGRHVRVVAVRPEGLLTLVGETLHFVRARDYAASAPDIHITYASSFELLPHITHATAQSTPSAAPRARSRRRSS